MNDAQRIGLARAEAAKRIMSDPMVQEALQGIEAAIVSAWKDMPIRDVEGREHLHRLLQAQRKFAAIFQAHMENGAIAAADLKAEEERKGLMSRIKERIHG